MEGFVLKSEYFDPSATLGCGQVFRFRPFREGFLAFAEDKACYVFCDGADTHVVSEDAAYFQNYFDVSRDYGEIVRAAKRCGVPALAAAAEKGKGIRILRQNAEEALLWFIVSQNNRIPRIRSIIERICTALGEERSFMGERYFAYPGAAKLAEKGADFYEALGAGYRGAYITKTAEAVAEGGLAPLYALRGGQLRKKLTEFAGVGPKVADCAALFGFADTGAFPVDTWIEKVYREDFGGKSKNREDIAAYFSEKFGEYGGFFQQYLFYYKRG